MSKMWDGCVKIHENCGGDSLARDADAGTHAICLDCDHRQLLFHAE